MMNKYAAQPVKSAALDESENITIVHKLASLGVVSLAKSEKSYGNSWKQRGGVGAFMMLARKWDRIENQVKAHKYDVFEAVTANPDKTGIIDDIRDLRRYLLLVESELIRTGVLEDGQTG